jgi:hypothetical protein
MANAQDFRRIVLGLRDAVEASHMGHPDFRVNGRIFATLKHDETKGMVVLTPEQQKQFVREHPSAFEPESGAWGRSGCTRVDLESVDEDTLGEAVTLARQNAVAKGPTRSSTRKKTATRNATAKRAGSRKTPARRTQRTRQR